MSAILHTFCAQFQVVHDKVI